MCLECCNESSQEVKACSSLTCSLWKFRLGRHPLLGDNPKNPFLTQENFVGLETLTSSQLINKINKEAKK